MTEVEKEKLRQVISRTDKSGNEKVDMLIELMEAYTAQQKFEIAQRCPVCGGNGMVPNGFYNTVTGIASTTSIIPETCRTCNGSGVYEQKSEIKLPTEAITIGLVREAWFEGMRQGVLFDRQDREIPSLTTTRLVKGRRISFIEWLRNQITESK